MKPSTLHNARVIVRDVVVPLCGVAIIVVQLFLPGERYGLIAAGVAMMGLSGVAYGGRWLDQKRVEAEADADKA